MTDSPYQLSSAMHDLLWTSVRTALQDASEAPAHTALAVANSVNTCVHSCVSDFLLRHNAAHSLQNRLPNEMWCTIWEWLPFFDRMRILRVCRAWRALALDTPALWSEILCFSTMHSDECFCYDCCGAEEGDYVPLWSDNPYPKRSTNIPGLSQHLPRGRGLDVHLSVDIADYMPAMPVLDNLAEACNPHASRLRTIHLRSGQHAVLQRFLSHFTSLSYLRTITVDWLVYDDTKWTEYDSSDVANRIHLPALEYLKIDDPHFRLNCKDLKLPALRSLSFCPCSAEEIATALVAFPLLSNLRANVSSLYDKSWSAEPPGVDKLRRAVRNASGVAFVINQMRSIDEAWALACFRRAKVLSLSYNNSICDLGCDIFRDLSGTVHLTWQTSEDGPILRAVNDAGCTRQLTVLSDIRSWQALRRIYEVIPPSRIGRLSVDASLWAAVAMDLPPGLRATSLDFTICRRDDIVARMPLPLQPAHFPVLYTVSIVPDPERDPPLGMDDISAFVSRLGLALPLAHVAVSHRIASRGDRLPLELARRTSIQ